MYGAQGQHNFYPPHHGAGVPGIAPGFAAPPKPVGVFWDIENCPIPKGTAPSSVVHYIRHSFIVNRLNHREFEFLVACDITKLRKDIPEDINKAGGVTLAHVSGQSKNAADEKLRESMKRFVDTHAAFTPMLILISGDIDFVNDLRGFQTRLGCNIVVLHGPTASQHFKVGWNEVYPFQDFLQRMPAPSSVASGIGGSANNVQVQRPPKNNETGFVPRGGQPQGQRPQFAKRAQNMNPGQRPQQPELRAQNPGAGFRPQNPGPGFRHQNPTPPVINPRNAARFPGNDGDGLNANGGGPQIQPLLSGLPHELSNRVKKKAQMQLTDTNGSSSNANGGGPHNQQLVPGSSPEHELSNRAKKRAQKQLQEANGGVPNANAGEPHQSNAQTRQNNRQGPANGEKKNKNGPKGQNQPGNYQGADGSQQFSKKQKNGDGSVQGANGGTNDPKGPKPNIILMVSGLPGKMDFRILKDHLQEYASSVSGRVMYVHNGQAFITFKKQSDADRAIGLFQGREVYGKKLNIQLSKTIPFQTPRPGSGAGTGMAGNSQGNPDGSFVMVDPNPQPFVDYREANPVPGHMSHSGSNSNLLAQGFVAFATAAMNELSLNQGDTEGQQGMAPGQKVKKQKTKSDPNCVVQ